MQSLITLNVPSLRRKAVVWIHDQTSVRDKHKIDQVKIKIPCYIVTWEKINDLKNQAQPNMMIMEERI